MRKRAWKLRNVHISSKTWNDHVTISETSPIRTLVQLTAQIHDTGSEDGRQITTALDASTLACELGVAYGTTKWVGWFNEAWGSHWAEFDSEFDMVTAISKSLSKHALGRPDGKGPYHKEPTFKMWRKIVFMERIEPAGWVEG